MAHATGMSLKNFYIIFDSPVFYAGQSISGRLVVEFTKPERLKGIIMNYLGHGAIRWRTDDKKQKIHFKNVEPFFNRQQLVFGSDKNECELAAGQHVFPFDCELQSNLPCSYKGEFGRIKYNVIVTIDRCRKFNNYSMEQPITILSVFDLNCLPIAAAPVSEKKCIIVLKELSPVHMSLDLPVRGFVPGQMIPIKVTTTIESYKVRVEKIIATLHQSALFRADRVNKKHSKVRLSETELAVEDGYGFQEVFLRIQVPAVPPSYLEFIDIIDIRYILTVEAKINSFPNDMKIDTEILIGNIPLMGYQKPAATQQPSSELDVPVYYSVSESSDDSPPSRSIIFPQLALHGNFSPPIYQQMMKFDSSTEPEPDLLYPVYSFTNMET